MIRLTDILFKLLTASTAETDRCFLMGDYQEIYEALSSSQGPLKACGWLMRQTVVSGFLCIYDWIIWRGTMLTNNLKITLRTFMRQKTYTMINVMGLALGIASTLLILLWVQNETGYDRFHEHADQLYVATFSNGSRVTPTALSAYLKSEYPEVIRSSSVQRWDTFLKYGELQNTEYGGLYANPDFLEMFSFNFTDGHKATALAAPHSIIISEHIAQKYFGNENPIGKTMIYSGQVDLKVTGVFKTFPDQSHLRIAYVLPMALLKEWGRDINSWQYNDLYTYVQLTPQADVAALNSKISNLVEKHRETEKRPLALQSILRLHLYNFSRPGGLITYVYIFSGLAAFTLIIACINFMNLATARATLRAREVGIRKTIGAVRRELIRQFYGESFVLTAVATMLGVVLAILFLPQFNILTAKSLKTAVLLQPSILLGILTIVLMTALVAGAYPALALSAFNPIAVMRGRISRGLKGAGFRKVLVSFQFSLSVFMILCTLIVFKQVRYMQTRDVGYDKENIVYFNIHNDFGEHQEAFRAELLKHPEIINMTATYMAPYAWGSNAGENSVFWTGQQDQKVSLVFNSVDEYFAQTFNLEMVEGRFFSEEFPTDVDNGFVVNEEAVRQMELKSPIGVELKFWDFKGPIIGVIKDYHFESMHRPIIPLALRMTPSRHQQLCIKISGNHVPDTISHIEEQWRKIYPDYAFSYRFLDDRLETLYRAEMRIGEIFKVFTSLAIAISCLGLFGLVAFTASQRRKEIAIRKVCGASSWRLHRLLQKETAQLILIAMVVGSPLAFWVMGRWLNGFAFKTPLKADLLFLTGGLALGLTFMTSIYHTLKAVATNPVKAIKED